MKNDNKDQVAQMERCRKPIIGAINELHITARFEIAQTNINKKKKKCKNYKKGMETNETRKGKYSKIILEEKKITKMKKPNKE